MCFVLNVLELGLRGALSSFCFFIVSLLSFVLWPWKFYAFSTRAEWRFCQLLTLKLYVRWHTCNVKHQFIKECFCNAFIYPKFYYLLKKTNHWWLQLLWLQLVKYNEWINSDDEEHENSTIDILGFSCVQWNNWLLKYKQFSQTINEIVNQKTKGRLKKTLIGPKKNEVSQNTFIIRAEHKLETKYRNRRNLREQTKWANTERVNRKYMMPEHCMQIRCI